MVTGQCNCGAVAFELTTAPTQIFACHCSICRRFTGTGGVMVVITPNDAFRWLRGEDAVRVWKKPDADWESNFCGHCGSSLPGRNDPDHMFIPAGLLPDDLKNLSVAHHIFVESKASWDVICDQGQHHAGPYQSG